MMRAVVAGGKIYAYGRAFGRDSLFEGAIVAEVSQEREIWYTLRDEEASL